MPDGRRKTTRQYEVSSIQVRHEEIIRRLVMGQKNVDIAKALKCSPQNVSDVRNSEIVQSMLKLMQESANQNVIDLDKRIKGLGEKAVTTLEDAMLQGHKTSDRISAAKDLLDRGGYKPVNKFESLHTTLTMQDLEKLKERAFKTKMIAQNKTEKEEEQNEIEEVEYEEVANAIDTD